MRRHRPATVASDLQLFEELDKRALVAVVEVGAVKMAAIAIPPKAGVEAEAVRLRFISGRDKTDMVQIDDVVAAVEHSGRWSDR